MAQSSGVSHGYLAQDYLPVVMSTELQDVQSWLLRLPPPPLPRPSTHLTEISYVLVAEERTVLVDSISQR